VNLVASRESRPSADELLARIKTEEEQKKRGRLKIFLGYVAGVGKTYTMLEAARQRKDELDVVVALVETHGRAETEALLEGLEIIPRKQVEYRGVTLTEMDLDAVLARRPKLALVDELAHTNAPDSRHPKRYQDVEELLEAGIDVYTTLNVQHVESLRNVVTQITGIWMRETVPDSVIDDASEIEVVDLPTDELLQRLQEGKVYVPAQIASATEKFFRRGNLTALREMTMRMAAKHVDEQTRAYMETHAIPGPWPSGERLLVCISPSPAGARLVRSARRLAYQLGAEWFALYVETPGAAMLSPDQQERLTRTLRLAERMSAKVVTIQGESVVTAVMEYAGRNNISKIMVGKTRKKRWQNLFRESIPDEIIRRSQHFDVYVVSGTEESSKWEQARPPRKKTLRNWRGYLLGFAVVVAATLLGHLIRELVAPTNLVMIYLLGVVVTAVFWGLGPSILVSALSVMAFDFFFIAPSLKLTVYDTQYLFTFAALFLVGVIISYLASRMRRHTEVARERERQTAALYALSRDLAVSNDLDSYVQAVMKGTKETFGYDVVIFLPDVQNKGTLKPYTEDSNITVAENELAAAIWSFQHQRMVGHGTDTLPNAKARYLPLVTARGMVGVMSLSSAEANSELTIEQERLLEAYADLAALAIEGILLAQEAHNTQALKAKEKLQTALLNAISHDLRTPLVSIIGVLSSLQEEGISLDEASRKNLIQVAREEAERLNHLITNLLDQSRIEAGAMRISRQPSQVQDLVGAALEQLGSRSSGRPIKIATPPELPFLLVDFGLIVQTLVNVLDNALKYSPPPSPIEITGRQVGEEVHLEVADRGIGIPPQDLTRVFDKFYRIQYPGNVAGTGLGLSICKGIVEAHGGRIAAENRPGGGTIIKLMLPVAESNQKHQEEAQ
jgi:two-component system sensor histidine kinase KdpD